MSLEGAETRLSFRSGPDEHTRHTPQAIQRPQLSQQCDVQYRKEPAECRTHSTRRLAESSVSNYFAHHSWLPKMSEVAVSVNVSKHANDIPRLLAEEVNKVSCAPRPLR